ncbi:MAG: DUF2723 domain-containing protein [Candidatus Aminicenantes bacterium]|nr:DUF2723 domain-containing protein [Candidatus Aminicenantes bacterium]
MNSRGLAAAALVVLFSVIYGLTLVPGIGLTGDSIKFQYIGRVLGVPHSTGYPVYLVLSHLFTGLPVKSVAFRANLLSAVFAVLTIAVLCLILGRLTGSAGTAFVAAAFFGLTVTFWSQAVVAEVYTLAAFFLALVFWTLIEWQVTGKSGALIAFLFAYGLSLGNHLTIIACLPAVLVFVILVQAKVFGRRKLWLFGSAALAAGLGSYGLLFLRTAQGAPYLEHEVRSFRDLLFLVTGHQFQDQMFAFSAKELLVDRIPLFIRMVIRDLTWPGLVIALAGLVFLFLRKRKVFALIFLALAGETIWILSTDIRDIQMHMIPVSLILCLAAGFGIFSLMSLARKHLSPWLPLVFIPFLAWLGTVNASEIDLGRNPAYRARLEQDRRLDALFQGIPPYSLILTDNYPDTQNVHYKRLIDYPEKNVIPHLLNPREPLASQLGTKLVVSLQTLPGLQERLGLAEELENMKGRSREAVGLRLLHLIRTDRGIQKGFAAHVYAATDDVRKKIAAAGIPIAPFTVRMSEEGRLYLFHRVSLFDPRE